MKYFSLIGFIIGILFFCSWSFFKPSPDASAWKVFKAAAKKIENKYHLLLVSEGVGNLPLEQRKSTGKKYKNISFSYSVRSPLLTVEDARRIIVPIVEDFLSEVNAYPEQVEKVIEYPLTVKNINLGICILSPQGQHVYDPHVWAVGTVIGKIRYDREIYVPPKPGVYGKQNNDVIETFEEAKRILAQESASQAASEDCKQ